jgi:pimeloyl-ACP methyl ester carboxylesterase
VTLALTVALALCAPGAASAQVSLANPPAGANNWSCRPSADRPDPVVLVHGLGATMGENWSYLSPLLAVHGWCVFALTYGVDPRDPYNGGVLPIERSAPELAAFVGRVLAVTGARKVDLVGHSEGTFMPEYWLKYLGGSREVNRYVALTPLYQGTNLAELGILRDLGEPLGVSQRIVSGFARYCGSCPEFLTGSPMVRELNAGAGGAAVPGVTYTTIPTRYDELVSPYRSGILNAPNVTNQVLQDVCRTDVSEHTAEAFDPVVAQVVMNALDPARARPVSCGGVPPLVGSPSPSAPGGSPSTGIPIPEKDPFYAVPGDLDRLQNGTVLASRPIKAVADPLPLPARAGQVKYKTTDNQNRATATVVTVMVPDLPWLEPGRRPLVVYQTAEDGVGTKCSPSYALRAGLSASDSNSEGQTAEIAAALARGWAVAAPDYEGIHSEFLGAPGEAHAVLDGVRAALRFRPDGLSARTPVALWGYSGGAYASSVAGEEQPDYAPELRLAGVALGGIPGSVRAELEAFSGTIAGGAIMVGIIGVDRSFPAARLTRYLTARGRALYAADQDACLNDAAQKSPFLTAADVGATPSVLNSPSVSKLLRSTSPDWYGSVPAEPVYDYHSPQDEFAPVGPDRLLVRRFCAAGVRVEHVEVPGEHIEGEAAGSPGAILWLSDRFAGRRAPDDCSRRGGLAGASGGPAAD